MTWCDYAACDRPAKHRADRWNFCTAHLRAHRQLVTTDQGRDELDAAERRRLAAYRRQQVARLYRKGWNDTQIARSLGLTRSYVGIIRRSLGLAGHVKVAECGTRSGFARHRARREQPCEPCRQAEREYDTAYKRQRRQQQVAA